VTAAVVVSDLDKDAASAVAGQVLPVDGGDLRGRADQEPGLRYQPTLP
jgi:hypothetical protein